MGTLRLIPVKDMQYVDWLSHRKQGIGASEVGAVLGLSPYTSSIEVFYDKISEAISPKVENIAMFMGKEQEAFIANLWQYWGGDEESLIMNYREGKKIRKCRRVNAYIHNDDYPHLFVSLDRAITKTVGKGRKGQKGVLEIKTISGFESQKWTSGIPPSYIMQVQTQCMVYGASYGELCIMRDGRHIDVFEFQKSDRICETIALRTGDFWAKVVKARKLVTDRIMHENNFNMRGVEELTAQIQSLEPDPDGTEAYEDFLKEKFSIAKAGERTGTIAEFEAAVRHRSLKNRISELQDSARREQNFLCRQMGDMNTLSFGPNGLVSWKQSGETRRFYNGIK